MFTTVCCEKRATSDKGYVCLRFFFFENKQARLFERAENVINYTVFGSVFSSTFRSLSLFLDNI